MSEIDRKLMQKRTLSYLGDRKQEGAFALSEEIDSCFEELEKEAHFLGCYEVYALDFDKEGFPEIPDAGVLLRSEDLKNLFASCERVCVLATTLGVSYDRYIRRIMNGNMSHGVVLDAAASAYLEGRTDAFEEELGLGKRTFRFAPGYGDLDLSLNIPLLKAIRADKKLGITHTSGGLFLPQKSMLGLIGLNGETAHADLGQKTPTCATCARREACRQKKSGSASCYFPDQTPGRA